MYDIITFGSAAKDIFIKTKDFQIVRGKEFLTGKGVCFTQGSKVEIDEIAFCSGGGGTNTAATFANQGFKVAYCGAVGNDLAGEEIVEELKSLGINNSLVIKSKDKSTNHSIVFIGDERTILVYRGASEDLNSNNVSWKKLKTDWFYIAPLSGELCNVFEKLVEFAHQNKIKVALNPGKCQLSLPEKVLRKALAKVDVLILNQEEASFLTKITFTDEKEIFEKIDDICPGIAIMTKGGQGVTISDGKYIYTAKPEPKRKVVDTTGAGDSFASGFVSEYIRTNSIEKAIQLAFANSAGCLSKLGAKAGLLKKNQKFTKVKVIIEECTRNSLCQCKVYD